MMVFPWCVRWLQKSDLFLYKKQHESCKHGQFLIRKRVAIFQFLMTILDLLRVPVYEYHYVKIRISKGGSFCSGAFGAGSAAVARGGEPGHPPKGKSLCEG
jgi:hypothetical protein